MNLRSMRARVTAGFVAAFAVLLIVTGTTLLLVAYYAEVGRVRTLLNATAHEVSAEVESGAATAREPQKMLALENTEFREEGLVMLIYDETGHLVGHSSMNAPTSEEQLDWLTISIHDGKRRIEIAYPRWNARRELNRLGMSLLAGAFIVLLASAIGAWALVGRVLSPIDRLAETARTAPVETAQLQAPSEDVEVERLVGTLNGFIARLRESNRAKERFYAAASHELRTPLQGLAGFLEIGLARPRERDELVEILREAQDQSQRLVKLTSDLLALNQLENSTINHSTEQTEIDVADVVERALRPLEAAREARHVVLNLELPSGSEAEITAPWSHVEMLVRNLIENAHKYAPDGGHIEVEWARGTLRVWNTVGWNATDRERAEAKGLNRLFEAFYRLDASREGQVTGNGLGLAICHAICESNGWVIELRATHGKEAGMEARVEFVSEHEAALPGGEGNDAGEIDYFGKSGRGGSEMGRA
ncbi:sensor kinase CusS [Abditibacteriota bacterium]|nr:sensor kinase CusS [Abditibacteriota bacterium]